MTDELATSNDDLRLYVIGGIHGRDLLDRMVEQIHRDIENHEGASASR
jgi:hypothetical protein